MKFLVILASTVAIAVAQRPTYAGLTPKGYPELASRFRDPADDQDGNNLNSFVVNRIGEDDDQTLLNLPTDARGDVVLVNRLNQWPRENRPFWLINAEHLEKHRRPNENLNQQQLNLNTLQGTQQRLNEIQPSFNRIQPELNRDQQSVAFNQQPVLDLQSNGGQNGLQSRFGEPITLEIRTIRPLSRRGSFAGGSTFR